MAIVISGVAEWTPPNAISNDELVTSYNRYADRFNAEHDSEIARGEIEAKPHSSAEFIEKASGIKSRFAYVKDGILDPDCMRPRIARRPRLKPDMFGSTRSRSISWARPSAVTSRVASAARNVSRNCCASRARKTST